MQLEHEVRLSFVVRRRAWNTEQRCPLIKLSSKSCGCWHFQTFFLRKFFFFRNKSVNQVQKILMTVIIKMYFFGQLSTCYSSIIIRFIIEIIFILQKRARWVSYKMRSNGKPLNRRVLQNILFTTSLFLTDKNKGFLSEIRSSERFSNSLQFFLEQMLRGYIIFASKTWRIIS